MTIISREKVAIRGLMKGNLMGTGFATKCMVMVFSPGPMDESMRDPTSTIKRKGMECSLGLIRGNTMGIG